MQVPKLPAGGNKRKLPDNPSPEMLKRMKMDTPVASNSGSTPPQSNGSKGKQRATTMEDVDDNEADGSRDFAPGGDADYFAEEDDEGRFFGGGLTSEQKDILNIFDNAASDTLQDNVRFPCVSFSTILMYTSSHHHKRCVRIYLNCAIL
jgi:beta-catenin-like protein 1